MKVYDDTRKKNSCDNMNMLGLDIKKINYEIPVQEKKGSLRKINKVSSAINTNSINSNAKNINSSIQA